MSSHCQKKFPLLVKKVPPVEVIEFGDSYVAPKNNAATSLTSEGTATKKGRTVAVTTKDMQKRRNDVKARTTLLLALLVEHQLRFSKYKTAQELWAAILKTFGGNEATKKTKKNMLKQQYGNFKAEAKNNSGNEEVNTASIPTASTQVSPVGPNVATASISLNTTCAYIASQSNGSQIKYEDINQIDKDDIEEMDIKWNMALLSMRADRYWKKIGKKISIQGTDVAGFDKSNMECFNCHKMGHFAKECRAPRSQEKGRRENYRQEENHALVVDEEAPTEFSLMAKSSADNGVFDHSLYYKACKKNTDSLNSKITDLSDKLYDTKTMLYHYKLGPSQVKARLVEFKSQEIKFCEKIRGLELDLCNKSFKIERLTNELEQAKKEKGDLDSKLTGFQSASKDLDNLLGSQRNDKNKEGLGYSVVPPPPAQVYSPSKKDMSWSGLPEFADDTITDYSRSSPAIESNSDDLQNRNPSVTETGASSSTILSKLAINFVNSADRPTETKTDKVETAKKLARVKRLERELKARTPPIKIHKVDRGRSRAVRFGKDQFAPILGYVDLVQGNVTTKRVYYVKGLNHHIISVCRFCNADLEENKVVSKSSAIFFKQNTTQSTPTPIDAESPQLIVHNTPDPTIQLYKYKLKNITILKQRIVHFNEAKFINPFATSVIEVGESSSSQVDLSNMHEFYQIHP
uniref:CCHC-type domain-containing protein n=1 Tax=Tanacetum cinerariifolium TaxID=118510 RepID=A0A699HPC0_TANCI|nr:hypothetical protein [Tanacetum cinerariifolium]